MAKKPNFQRAMQRVRAVKPLLVASLTLSVALVGQAQAIYRIVGPDGKISFSDKAPEAGTQSTSLDASGRLQGDSNLTDMPYEVREAMSHYPVVLYTGDDCDPCNAARGLLQRRGVPYTERTLRTNDDIAALKKLGLDASVPAATIGSQRLKGYSEEDWSAYLDAAGYPRTSRLPSSYRNPTPQPLTAPAVAGADSGSGARTLPAGAPVAAPAPALSQPGPTPDNPAGIVF